jgi:hypothetical protein
VHRDVVYTRLLLKKIKLKNNDEVMFMDNRLFDKLSVEMYEYVIKNQISVTLRNGNWAQEFYRLDEMMVYINAQFIDKDFIYEVMNPQQSNDGE